MDSRNSVVYDPALRAYWLNVSNEPLYATREPHFNFSAEKHFAGINRYYCTHYTPKAGDTVVDIGAGTGTESVFFSKAIGSDGKLVSIEASPDSFKLMEKLCEKRALTNAINLQLAIADKPGSLWMEETDRYQENAINTEQKGVEVKAATLDHVVKQTGITKIDLLKVNIEGAEYQMVDGMQESIHLVANAAISCHDFLHDGKKIKEKVTNFFRSNGFEITYNNTGNEVLDSWIYARRR